MSCKEKELRGFRKLRRKHPIQLCILGEAIYERHDDVAVEQQSLAFAGVGHVAQLMGEMFNCLARICRSPPAWFIIRTKSEFSKMFSTSRDESKSLTF